jgi:hypothetical protein
MEDKHEQNNRISKEFDQVNFSHLLIFNSNAIITYLILTQSVIATKLQIGSNQIMDIENRMFNESNTKVSKSYVSNYSVG